MLENINPEGNAAEIKMLISVLHLSVKKLARPSSSLTVAWLYMCRGKKKNTIQAMFFVFFSITCGVAGQPSSGVGCCATGGHEF